MTTALITGGTGSFGNEYVRTALSSDKFSKIIILSRDEMKQWHMAQKFNDSRLRFFIGDVRDEQRLVRAFQGVDVVIHAAATKIVPTAEYNPLEAIKTNIDGARNVIEASLVAGVKKVVALSTDKASSPINLYGATKLVSDKLFVAANNYSSPGGTKFSVVRYGNVMGSRGSIIPFLLSLEPGTPTPITDERMTRFMISLDEGVRLVDSALETMHGGEIYIKKIPSMKVVDLASTIRPNEQMVIVGTRPGEKLHEQMIGEEDSPFTFDYGDHFRIFPFETLGRKRFGDVAGEPVVDGFKYSSDTNEKWMPAEALRKWLATNRDV